MGTMMETETVHRQASAQVTRRNKLNELSGRDWIKFTKSWFVHRPDPRGDRKIRHPASFPESLVREFVSFFTKKGEIVVDPFVGTGSTLVAALETERSGIGFEIVKKYADISKERVGDTLAQRRARKEATESKSSWAKIITADSARLSKIWKAKSSAPKLDDLNPKPMSPAVDAYFSPRGGVEQQILTLIGGAAQTIEIAAYAFT